MKKLVVITACIIFFSLPEKVSAWSQYYVPTRFAGMFYDSPGNNWSNVTNVATLTDNEYATVNVQFGNPAPQIWYQSFGFSAPDIVGDTITKIEVDMRVRRRYNVSPSETVYVYIVKPDGDVVNALNATDGTFYHVITDTSFKDKTFEWKDQASPDDRVSQYLPYFDDYDFTVVVGVTKNAASGSTNFIDISQMKIRFENTESDISHLVPVDVSKIDLAVEQLEDTISSRAPFAYFQAVTSLDFSPVASSSPEFYLPVPYPDEYGGTVNYPMNIPEEMLDILQPLRWITGIAIIGLLVLYLSQLGNRVL